jgi:16S rRNA (guanine966-N2)-methyltransferase
MRITGGFYKNRRINIPKSGHDIRPTSDKMRQAIFNMLDHASWGMSLDGKVMIDGFCGSGIMGIEALSRGAQKTTFIDKDRAALNRLKHLLRDDLQINQDAYQLLASDLAKPHILSGTPNGSLDQHDLVFLDPPYRKDLISVTLSRLAGLNALSDDALCLCETEKDAAFATLPDRFKIEDERAYGDTKLVILRYQTAIE